MFLSQEFRPPPISYDNPRSGCNLPTPERLIVYDLAPFGFNMTTSPCQFEQYSYNPDNFVIHRLPCLYVLRLNVRLTYRVPLESGPTALIE